MSLGPPLDGSSQRLQLWVGAGLSTVLLWAVLIALLASDRTLGQTFALHVLFRSPGALHTGAEVRMAGQHIGEVVAIRGVRYAKRSRDDTAPTVDVELRVLRSYQRYLPKNASFFTDTPNVLTEALLEVGPPRDGARPLLPVQDGDRVRGDDPPDIDRLLQKVLAYVETILKLGGDLRPEWDEFRGAFSHLSATLSALPSAGQLVRIGHKGDQAMDSGRRVVAAFRDADALARTQALLGDLSRGLNRARPDLLHISHQLGLMQERLEGLGTVLGPAERKKLGAGVDSFRQVLDIADQVAADLLWLTKYVEMGRGTLGGFQSDLQIFDELKETHRILKHQSWRLLLKQRDKGQRNLR